MHYHQYEIKTTVIVLVTMTLIRFHGKHTTKTTRKLIKPATK